MLEAHLGRTHGLPLRGICGPWASGLQDLTVKEGCPLMGLGCWVVFHWGDLGEAKINGCLRSLATVAGALCHLGRKHS